jgi:hypothetical protein
MPVIQWSNHERCRFSVHRSFGRRFVPSGCLWHECVCHDAVSNYTSDIKDEVQEDRNHKDGLIFLMRFPLPGADGKRRRPGDIPDTGRRRQEEAAGSTG